MRRLITTFAADCAENMLTFAVNNAIFDAKYAVNMKYIHDSPEWPNFRWQAEALETRLARVRYRQGRLIGDMESLGFALRNEAMMDTLTEDSMKTSEIEGEMLDRQQVRSSIARRLGMDIGALSASDRHTDGVVDMLLDATGNFTEPLTEDRLFAWHSALFPSGRSGIRRIVTGAWRGRESGPMQVVSGPFGREHVHFEAPDAGRLHDEMGVFLTWFNAEQPVDPVLKAAVAHFRFVTIHPFEDGNGRIARAIADMMLARSEGISQRFYSMSSAIRAERSAYYAILEKSQKSDLDITAWLEWFLNCLERAFAASDVMLSRVLRKARFWEKHRTGVSDRQREVLNRLLDGFDGKMTSSKWAKIAKCSQDTALRDIEDLLRHGALVKSAEGGRSTAYVLAEP
jgi:Fic family protein